MRFIMLWIGFFSIMWAMPVEGRSDVDGTLKADMIAAIIKVKGKAKLLPSGSIMKQKVQTGDKLFAGDTLITYMGSILLIELADHSTVILNENSELAFLDSRRLKQSGGEIYYKIKKRIVSEGLKIETPFSIIGIKGTEFIVNSKGSEGKIALKEGLIGIESMKAEFELHKQKVMQAYEQYKNEQLKGFEEYKAEFDSETVTYVKAFELNAGKLLEFNNAQSCQSDCEKRVSEAEITDAGEQRFDEYTAMLNE